MSREFDGGREPRQAPDRGKDGKSVDSLRFEEGREESPLEPRPPAKGARGGKQAESLRFGPNTRSSVRRTQAAPPGLEEGVRPEGAGGYGYHRARAPGGYSPRTGPAWARGGAGKHGPP